MKAKLTLSKAFTVGDTDKRIYGSFIEHLGRAVYGGIYEPTHPTADDMGFRRDVLELVKKLNIPLVRYPGGNFVSGYNWEDGIGERSKRPRRPELAWHAIETNEVGTDEFVNWCRRAGCEVFEAVNLGTRGPEDAANLLEYCNFPRGTYYSDLRRANGSEQPHNIKLWCLGNEMDGEWQICHKTAEEYGRVAAETGKMMRQLDPDIELAACGSSGPGMPTFGQWETTVLEKAYDYIDYLSLHIYFNNPSGDTPEFLAKSLEMDEFIENVEAVCDSVKARTRRKKQINLSFDEWNVWYHSNGDLHEPWLTAPRDLEDIYNMEDALVVGCMLISLLKHCDRVKIACLAQLINVIAPIMTQNGGPAWAQTIYWPFMHASNFARGKVLSPAVECDCYDTAQKTGVPYVEAVGVIGEDGCLTVLAVNRALSEDIDLEIDLRDFPTATPKEHIVLNHADLKAVNTTENPDNVVPCLCEAAAVENGRAICRLQPHSWNVVRFNLK